MDTEKITINLGAVDLGQIDLLVDQGFYSNRSDFIRTAIRTMLSTHGDDLQRIKSTNLFRMDKVVSELNKVNDEATQAVQEVEKINPASRGGYSFAGTGMFVFDKAYLESVKISGRKIEATIVGMLVITKDVSVELVKETFKKAKVYGVIKASEEVKSALLNIADNKH
ncbi:hypothetical protein [Acetanaerobacterium elongatum]|uniref:Transcriptional regulator, contains Arc/MetJ-type RHH (Ribbon-helix-helix) DNA-binding domain n=1 Tax=Acetanaerobacterium elongatum TaxID=258515 RepID=A0A1G9X0K2_9FIRM|nr:hypothetical protein [Acetanaerobacterium elongatum]SDM90354.1 hypothetical protein SAMN05192585_10755 [Acetanaerobacterium elongatum]